VPVNFFHEVPNCTEVTDLVEIDLVLGPPSLSMVVERYPRKGVLQVSRIFLIEPAELEVFLFFVENLVTL